MPRRWPPGSLTLAANLNEGLDKPIANVLHNGYGSDQAAVKIFE